MNTSLYQLTTEYTALVEKLNDLDLDKQTILDTLEGASGDLQTKAINFAMYIRNSESMAEQIKLAEQEMVARRKAIENRVDTLKSTLKDAMTATGLTEIACPYFVLKIKKNPPSVIIDDVAAIPSQFMIAPLAPPPMPDKAKIKLAIQNGEVVEGAHIEQGDRLEIK